MFQYTTETIINSNVGRLPGGKRFGVIGAGDAQLQTSSITANDFFVIDGVNSFKIEHIKKIYKTDYRDSSLATATLDLGVKGTALGAKKVFRLTVTIREQGSVRSTIQNAYLHKSKPFHYEIEFESTAKNSDVANKFDALIRRDMAMTDFNYFKSSVDVSGANAKLVLTADDCYIQFVDARIEEVLEIEDNNTPLAAKLLGYKVVSDTPKAVAICTPGDEGQGTVARLVKNLRIPTNASINPFAADQGGKPVPGGKYTQFLIEYETPRAHVSGTVVGSVGEVSRTSHVFFIESAALDNWNTVLGYFEDIPTNDALKPIVAGKDASNPGITDGKLTSKKEMGSVE